MATVPGSFSRSSPQPRKRLMRGRLRVGAATLATGVGLVTLTACGTSAVPIAYSVTVADPKSTTPAAPTQVSVFDPTMGDTRDWAGRFMGTSAPGAPFVTSYQLTTTKLIGDNGGPKEVPLGLALPSYTDTGYFRYLLRPVAGEQQTVEGGFVPYVESDPTGSAIIAPTLRTLTAPNGHGWAITMRVEVPAARQAVSSPPTASPGTPSP